MANEHHNGEVRIRPVGDLTNPDNTKQDVGLTIDQGTSDLEAISLKSNHVSHGLTDVTEADTYGFLQKSSSFGGGMSVQGFSLGGVSEDKVGIRIVGYGITPDMGKSSSAPAFVEIDALKRNGMDVTDVIAPTGNENILAVKAGNFTQFIVDASGGTWQSGSIQWGGGQSIASSNDVATLVAGVVPVAKGGTGLSSPGTEDQVLTIVSGAPAWAASVGSGESNTASNLNLAGVGVFKQKVGVDLQFRGVAAAVGGRTQVTEDVVTNTIRIDVVESALSIDGTQIVGQIADARLSANVALLNGGQTFTAAPAFNPGMPGAPFVIGANGQGQFIAGLNADLLDGQQGSHYLDLANATGVLAFGKGGTGLSTVGTEGQVLTSLSGAPAWADIPQGTPDAYATIQVGGGSIGASGADQVLFRSPDSSLNLALVSNDPTDGDVVEFSVDDMVGASVGAAGTRGFVPAPIANDNTKFLRGDGTWQVVGDVTGNRVPFFKADGTEDPIALIANNTEIPFFKADGTQDNIGVI